jgi:hypothetical protein
VANDAPPTHEFGAQERAATASRIFLLEGPQRSNDIAARLYDSEQDGWHLLNNISRPLSLVNNGGWWHVNFETPFDYVRPLLHEAGVRLEETPVGVAYCRAARRKDWERLYAVLRQIYRIGQPPALP